MRNNRERRLCIRAFKDDALFRERIERRGEAFCCEKSHAIGASPAQRDQNYVCLGRGRGKHRYRKGEQAAEDQSEP